jgi:hypothetical protein
MEAKFEDLVKKGVMTRAQADSLSALSAALDMIEYIGPQVERDREKSSGELNPNE